MDVRVCEGQVQAGGKVVHRVEGGRMAKRLIKMEESGGICRSGRLQLRTLSPGVDDLFGGMKGHGLAAGSLRYNGDAWPIRRFE